MRIKNSFLRALPFFPQLLNYRDKDVLQRIGLLTRPTHLYAFTAQPLGDVANSTRRVFIHYHVQAIPEQRDTPAIQRALEQVVRTLQRISDDLDQMAFLFGLQT